MHRLRIVVHELVQIAGNGALELGSGVVQRSQASLQRDRVNRSIAVVRLLVEHLLLLLEAAEVLLDEERGVELAHCHFVVDCEMAKAKSTVFTRAIVKLTG